MSISPNSQYSLGFALSLLKIFNSLIFSEATTLELIHRDSPLSPVYDPSLTHAHRLRNALHHSLDRVNSFKHANRTKTPLQTYGGIYFMKYSIGTPPFEVVGIADTGSDLIWTQCRPCIRCYKQTPPIFDPSKSKSYHTLPCKSSFCSSRYVESPGCSKGTCQYYYDYFDNSHTAGNLATETITIGNENPVTSSKTVFGCAHDSVGTFPSFASGLIGLGRGKLSLLSQLGIRKLSYCLTPSIGNTSKIVLGEDAVVSGAEVVRTPLATDSSKYRITLETLSVGKKRIEFENVMEGNMAVDSGTTFTFLPPALYNGLVAALDKTIRYPRVVDPHGVLKHCYDIGEPEKIIFPIITAHFKGGDVKLKPINTFFWVTDRVVCLSMFPSEVGFFGNIAQLNFWVGYDLEASTVFFKPADCTS